MVAACCTVKCKSSEWESTIGSPVVVSHEANHAAGLSRQRGGESVNSTSGRTTASLKRWDWSLEIVFDQKKNFTGTGHSENSAETECSAKSCIWTRKLSCQVNQDNIRPNYSTESLLGRTLIVSHNVSLAASCLCSCQTERRYTSFGWAVGE